MADIFPECERFRNVPHRYANCRGERLTVDKCNKWRASHGLPPLGNATTPPPGSPPKSKKWRGLGDAVHAVTTATGIKAAVDSVAKATGLPCGCQKRREWLNQAVPFKGVE